MENNSENTNQGYQPSPASEATLTKIYKFQKINVVVGIILIVVLIAVSAIIVPKIAKLVDSTTVMVEQINEVVDQVTDSYDEIIDTVENINDTVEGINNIDFEAFGDAVNSLSTVVNKITGIFK